MHYTITQTSPYHTVSASRTKITESTNKIYRRQKQTNDPLLPCHIMPPSSLHHKQPKRQFKIHQAKMNFNLRLCEIILLRQRQVVICTESTRLGVRGSVTPQEDSPETPPTLSLSLVSQSPDDKYGKGVTEQKALKTSRRSHPVLW